MPLSPAEQAELQALRSELAPPSPPAPGRAPTLVPGADPGVTIDEIENEMTFRARGARPSAKFAMSNESLGDLWQALTTAQDQPNGQAPQAQPSSPAPAGLSPAERAELDSLRSELPDMPALDQGANTPAPEAPDRFKAFRAGLNTGVSSLLGLPVETAKNAVNLGIAGVGTVATALGRPDLAPDVIQHTPGDIQTFKGLLGNVGIRTDNPNPEDQASRILHGAGAGVGASPGGPGALAAGAAAGTGSAVARELFPESRIAPLLGALVPGAGGRAVQATVRGAARGGAAGREAMQDEIRAFEQARTTPSLGQATGNRGLQATENMLASTPGAGGVMANRAEQQAGDLGTGVTKAVDALTRKTGADVAGGVIKGGISGPGGFVERFKTTSAQLYNDVDRHLPPDLRVTPQATAAKLEELTTPIQGAENVSSVLQNPKVAGLQKQLTADLSANNGVLPYQALKALRTKVGSMLSGSELLADIPKAEIKQLYGALSEDMRAAATQAGPQALQAFERANNYTAAGHKRIEDHLQSIANKVDPEDVYKAALSGTNEGASTLRAIKRSLKPDEFRVVAATAFNRLGRALPNKQNDLGERFSTETFLSNWTRLDDKAKRELLSGYEGAGQIEHSLNATAKVAANARDGSKVWANPSGTAGKVGLVGTAGAATYAVATGQLGAAGLILGGMATANVSARILTNPKVVKWIAEGTRLPDQAVAAHLTRLASIAAQIKDPEEKEEAEELLRSTTEQLANAQGK